MPITLPTPEEEAIRRERMKHHVAYLNALEAGDDQLAEELFPKMPFDVDTLLAMKRLEGPDWIKERGINTGEADKALGSNWLER